MPNEKTRRGDKISGVQAQVVQDVVEVAQKKGVPSEVAKDIIRDAVGEGVAPDKLREVAEEAINAEREDRANEK